MDPSTIVMKLDRHVLSFSTARRNPIPLMANHLVISPRGKAIEKAGGEAIMTGFGETKLGGYPRNGRPKVTGSRGCVSSDWK